MMFTSDTSALALSSMIAKAVSEGIISGQAWGRTTKRIFW